MVKVLKYYILSVFYLHVVSSISFPDFISAANTVLYLLPVPPAEALPGMVKRRPVSSPLGLAWHSVIPIIEPEF